MQKDVTVTKQKEFSAAHHLPHHQGKCRFTHGHTYTVTVSVTGPVMGIHDRNPESGMVVDVAAAIGPFLTWVHEMLDHTSLNDWDQCPTAERLALHLAREACRRIDLAHTRAWVSGLVVSEGPGVTAAVELNAQEYRQLAAGANFKAVSPEAKLSPPSE